jgi:hypothetical protein
MSGPVGVPATVIGAWATSGYIQYGLIATGVICAFISSFLVWRKQYRRVLELEGKLLPKIKVFLNPQNNGILIIDAEKGPNRIQSKWIQVCIEPIEETLHNCQATLVKFERINPDGKKRIFRIRTHSLPMEYAAGKQTENGHFFWNQCSC